MAKQEYTLNGRKYDGNTIRQRVANYNKTPEGKKRRKEWYEKNKERMKDWTKEHLQKKREWARENNYCTTCFKNEPVQGYKTCERCIIRQRGYKAGKQNESKTK